MDRISFNIAKEFSLVPGARYIREGDFSGELFRKNYLLPMVENVIKTNSILVLNLDGTAGYGTSFLEEAFGGLIRDGIKKGDILNHIEFISLEDPSYIDEIMEYIDDAHNHENH